MKKTISLHNITGLFCLIILFSLLVVNGFAQQQRGTQAPDDTVVAGLARKLSVSNEKARKINTALHFREKEILATTRDSTLNPNERHIKLQRLFFERKRMIDSVMTKDDKQTVKRAFADVIQRQDQDRNRRQNAQMAKVDQASKNRRIVSSRTDTVITKKNPR